MLARAFIGFTSRQFQHLERGLLNSTAQRGREELAGSLDRSAFGRNQRGSRQRIDAVVWFFAANNLTLVEIDHVTGSRRKQRDAGEHGPRLAWLDRVQGHLAVLHRIERVRSGGEHLLRLPNEFLGAHRAGKRLHTRFVRQGQRVEVTKLHREFL